MCHTLELFKACYHTSFDKKQDAKLRNDIRRLQRLIEKAIINWCRSIETEKIGCPNSIVLLTYLMDKRQDALLEKYWNKFYKKT